MKIFLDLFEIDNQEIKDNLIKFIETSQLPFYKINEINHFKILAYPFTRIINNYFQFTVKIGYFFPLDLFVKLYGKLYTHFFIKYSPVKLIKKNNFKGINFFAFHEDKVIYLDEKEKKEENINNFYISFPYYFFKIFSKIYLPPYKPFVNIKKELLNIFLKKFTNFVGKSIKFPRVMLKNIILPPELNWEKLYHLVLYKTPLVHPKDGEIFIIYDKKENYETAKNFLNLILENKKISLKIKKIKLKPLLFEDPKRVIKLIRSLNKVFLKNIYSVFLIIFEDLDISKFIKSIIKDAVIIDPSYLSIADFKYKVHKALNILNLLGFQLYSLPGLRNFKRVINIIDYPKKYLINTFEDGIIKKAYFIEKSDRNFLDIYKDSIFILPFSPENENISFLRYYPSNLPDFFPKTVERGYAVFEDFLFKYYFSFWKENSISFSYGDINILPYIVEGLISNNAILPLRYKNIDTR